MALQVRRHGGFRRPEAEGPRGREPEAEKALGGVDDRQCHAEGNADKKLLTPRLRRTAVSWAIQEKSYSQRKACALVGLEPKALGDCCTRTDAEPIRCRLRDQRRRFGYRRLGLLLGREGIRLNHKKLYRLYREERLMVRQRGGARRAPRRHSTS